MRQLIVGSKGEAGAALYEVLSQNEAHTTVGVDLQDGPDITTTALVYFDVMHICIPYNENFDLAVRQYKDQFLAEEGLLIIHSTVEVGTSAKHGAVHSPIRGVHPNLVAGIRTFEKYFGGPRAEEAAAIFRDLNITCVCTDKAENTEALKLWDTTYYGWNIVFEKAVHAYCQEHQLDFDLVYRQANESYNRGFTMLGMSHVVRPVMKDIEGKIGGHCVISNARILKGPIADFILQQNQGWAKIRKAGEPPSESLVVCPLCGSDLLFCAPGCYCSSTTCTFAC
jgi:hypothetical protein